MQARLRSGAFEIAVKGYGLPRYHGIGLILSPIRVVIYGNSGGTDDIYRPRSESFGDVLF